MYWLTIDRDRYSKIWRLEPVYFDGTGEWGCPRGIIASMNEWPALMDLVNSHNLAPGPKGKIEVRIEISGIAV